LFLTTKGDLVASANRRKYDGPLIHCVLTQENWKAASKKWNTVKKKIGRKVGFKRLYMWKPHTLPFIHILQFWNSRRQYHFGLEKDTHHETRSEAHGYEKKHQQ